MTQPKRWLTVILLGLALIAPAANANAARPINVVASFSVLADMVRQVGGAGVDVSALVTRNTDPHAYSPSAAAARTLASADLVVVNGLRLEGWLARLIEASGYAGPVVVATQGVDPLATSAHGHSHEHNHEQHEIHQHGVYDPHAWQNAANGIIYVRNIGQALAQVDPAHAGIYRSRARDYIQRLQALDADIASRIAALPAHRRTVVAAHNAFRYYGHAYGIHFLAPVGLSTAAAASAGEVASLIQSIRDRGIDALFTETTSDPRLIEQIARETGARIGGKLYSDALSGHDGPASTYIDMLRYNTAQIVNALRSGD